MAEFFVSVWNFIKSIPEWAYDMFWFAKNIKETRKALEKPTLSAEGRFCPNCDKRMTVIQGGRFEAWHYRCGACVHTFIYPAPTRGMNDPQPAKRAPKYHSEL
jgi:hypothetical protein